MSLATHSPEMIVRNGLDILGCPEKPFVAIAQKLGITIGNGRFNECMNGKRDFDLSTGEKLIKLVKDLKRLRDFHLPPPTPLDWSQAEDISILVRWSQIRDETEMGVADREQIT